MKKTQRNKGITLIALVVTIIIAIILAAVVITSSTGEEGVVTISKESKEDTRGEIVYSEVQKWKTETEQARTEGRAEKSMEDFLEELLEKEFMTQEEVDKVLNSRRHEVTIGKRTISFLIANNSRGEG